mmetsp:Transcript_14068/g.46642  ORF Transcript_14068/g.46642 Transcript_14068/m.46642 type:complete len:254 (-) Transcript_14068:1582-2343(-)
MKGASTTTFEKCFMCAGEFFASKPTNTVISAREYKELPEFVCAAFDCLPVLNVDISDTANVSFTNVAPRIRTTLWCATGSGSACTSVSSKAPATVLCSDPSLENAADDNALTTTGAVDTDDVPVTTRVSSSPRVPAPPTGHKALHSSSSSSRLAVAAVTPVPSLANNARCTVAPPIATTAPLGSAALSILCSAAADCPRRANLFIAMTFGVNGPGGFAEAFLFNFASTTSSVSVSSVSSASASAAPSSSSSTA